MNILGIETSCDENSVAIVKDGQEVLSSVVYSQVDLHKIYGGVVPEVAARSHIEVMIPTVDAALEQAFGKLENNPSQPASDPRFLTSEYWDQIDAIAVTRGPGLGGSLLIGMLTARTLALVKDKPLYGINHVLSHVYANFVRPEGTNQLDWQPPQFPLLALIVSGGHSQLVLFKDHFNYQMLGQTQDDAVGEAFDKVAKIIGLPYPGGPSVQQAAEQGDPEFIKLPEAKLDNPYDFSFSGLKTAVLRSVQQLAGVSYDFPSFELADKLSDVQVNNVAASFQATAVKILASKTLKAYQEFKPQTVVIAGGVAANNSLRAELKQRLPIDINYAPINWCLDNAVMSAALGYYASQYSLADNPLLLEIEPSLSM